MLRRYCSQAARLMLRGPPQKLASSFSSSSSSSSSPAAAASASTAAAAAAAEHYHTIQAVPREYAGSRSSARERSQGRIPSVVFSQGDDIGNGFRPISRKQLLSTEKKQIKSLMKTLNQDFFCSTTFQLQIRAGSGSSFLLESGRVLPLKVHKNPETGEILNLVFTWVDDKPEVPINVPVVFKGEDLCPGLKKGGHLNKIRTTIKLQCPVEQIPQKIEVDVSKLDIGEKIMLEDIEIHPSLKLLSKNNIIPICKVVTAKSEDPLPTNV